MNNATKLPSDDTAPTTLTPLYPDTQNETARNLTKSERLAVMQRIQELVLQLNTRRFDPSTVASEKTCMDVSKLLPASLDHEDERDEALETLRNLMSTSFDMLNECFNKGGSRDDLKRPNWAPAKGRQEQSVAMAKLLSHCLWALFAFVDSVREMQRDTAGKKYVQGAKLAIATALFPTFQEFLALDKFHTLPPTALRDLLDIIGWAVKDARAVRQYFHSAAYRTLSTILAYAWDGIACSAAYDIAARFIVPSEEENCKRTEMLFPSNFYNKQITTMLREFWNSIPYDGIAIKEFRPSFLAKLASTSPRQAQIFSCASASISVGSNRLKLATDPAIRKGGYSLVLNDRSLSTCFLHGTEEDVQVLDIMLDTLLSIHCNEDKEVHFVTNDMPTTNPEIFTHRPGEAITSIFKMESEDLDRLQSILKYRYTPVLNSRSMPTEEQLGKPKKASMSQEPIRAVTQSSQDSDNTQEKMQARAAQYTKIIDGGSTDDIQDEVEVFRSASSPSKSEAAHVPLKMDPGESVKASERSGNHARQSEVPKLATSGSIAERRITASKDSPDATTMSLDNSGDSDPPRVLALESIRTRESEVVRSHSSEKPVNLKTYGRKSSPGGSSYAEEARSPHEKIIKADTDTNKSSVKSQARLHGLGNTIAECSVTTILDNASSSDDEVPVVTSARKSNIKRKIRVDDSDSEYEPTARAKRITKKEWTSDTGEKRDTESKDKTGNKKKKARDSGFDDATEPKGSTAKAKFRAKNDLSDTDYDDPVKAGLENSKLKRTSASRGRGTGRGRGRGRGRGKVTASSVTATRRGNTDKTEEPRSVNQEEAEIPEKRVTRSRARAKPVVQGASVVTKRVDYVEENSYEEEQDGRTGIKVSRRISPPLSVDSRKTEGLGSASIEEDAESDFSDRYEPVKVAKSINTFSQLVDRSRNPTVAQKFENNASYPEPSSTTKVDTHGRKSSAVDPKRDQKMEFANGQFSPAKNINDAFEDLFAESPEDVQGEAEHLHDAAGCPAQDTDRDDDAMRNFTTLYDDHEMHVDTGIVNDFFAQNAQTEQPPTADELDDVRRSIPSGPVSKHEEGGHLPIERAEVTCAERSSARGGGTDYARLAEHFKHDDASEVSVIAAIGDHIGDSKVQVEFVKTIRNGRVDGRDVSHVHEKHIISESSMEVDAIVAESKGHISMTGVESASNELPSTTAREQKLQTVSEQDTNLRVERETETRDRYVAAQASVKVPPPTKAVAKGGNYSAGTAEAVLNDLEEGLAQVMRSDLRFQDDDNRGARRGKTRIGPHYKEVIKTEKDDKAVASRSFSPIKTSTPAKGYDEEEHQTQLLEDPIEALQTQQAANSREKVAIKPAKKQQHHERAPVIREVRKKRVSSPESDEVTQEPDKLVDLNVKLAMLLVDNHRTSLKSYKSVKSAGINSIIDIVATGCSEAEQMDINFLQSLHADSEEIHEKQAAAMSGLKEVIKTLEGEKAKTIQESRVVNDDRNSLNSKLSPGLFSGFKSLQKIQSRR